MSCSNCFNGCSDITSDQCVKYTGSDVTSLGINNGDPLSTIITKLSTYLINALDGTAITPDVSDTCALIETYLGTGTTLNDFISALIQASCSLQTQVTSLQSSITTLNADYTTNCLSGVNSSSGTHDIVQAVITKLCSVDSTLTALALSISANYVKLADLNSLIANYLSSTSLTTLMSSRMVPYVAMPFFAPDSYMLGKFDVTGAGIGTWANIYLCNGRNGTPDMRGRVPVGVVSDMNGGTLNSNVDPANGNPDYSLNDIQGENNVRLTSLSQIPSHTHVATVNLTDPTHYHYLAANVNVTNTPPVISSTTYMARQMRDGDNSDNYQLKSSTSVASVGKSSSASTGISASVSNSYVGGSATHNNIQPVKACYYIIYIP